MFDKRLDRAFRFQKERNGNGEEETAPAKPEAEEKEKVGVKEMLLMILSAWGIFLPVAVVILLAMVLITRFLFGV